MKTFAHYTPRSLRETFALLAQLNGECHVIAGGTDLLLKMKSGALEASAIVNIKQLPELQGISYSDKSGLRIGALTTVRELTRCTLIRQHYPALLGAGELLASEQIRSLATVGGNLCNAAPSADLAPPLIAFRGIARIVGPAGDRECRLQDFFLGPGKTTLASGELLKEINLPSPTGHAIYLRHTPRALMDIAVVGVSIWAELEDNVCRAARIVLGAVAPVPLRASEAEAVITGGKLTKRVIDQTAEAAAQACAPIDDVRSSAAYRRRIVAVLTKRGIQAILDQQRDEA